jgi:hypothetical protein
MISITAWLRLSILDLRPFRSIKRDSKRDVPRKTRHRVFFWVTTLANYFFFSGSSRFEVKPPTRTQYTRRKRMVVPTVKFASLGVATDDRRPTTPDSTDPKPPWTPDPGIHIPRGVFTNLIGVLPCHLSSIKRDIQSYPNQRHHRYGRFTSVTTTTGG